MTPNCRTLPTPLSPWAVALFATALMHPLAASSSENPGHRVGDLFRILVMVRDDNHERFHWQGLLQRYAEAQ